MRGSVACCFERPEQLHLKKELQLETQSLIMGM